MPNSVTANLRNSDTQLSSKLNDVLAGLVVFLVALPLCLGVALASDAPLLSGIIAGVIGGIVVGLLSGSKTSVSGPAAGLTVIVAMQIGRLGSFEAFLLAVLIAGALQVLLGLAQAGRLSSFIPSSVINGLLAAIGVILILKQIPHLLGHDSDPEGEMAFVQPDHENTFTELLTLFRGEVHLGAMVIGLLSLVLLLAWNRFDLLKKLPIPVQLVVVLVAVALNRIFLSLGEPWVILESHLVQVPVVGSGDGIMSFFSTPNFSMWNNPAIYTSAATIAAVASLETLLNLEAVDKLDPLKRSSPPNRELVAQGVGNMLTGLLGGIPVTSVIIRGSVNINAGAQSKLSTVVHGILLLVSVAVLPSYLNMIPLSALAAILLVTGIKLASPALFRRMAAGGRYQFVPFLVTLLAIVFSDLLIGILIGLVVSVFFVLNSSVRFPVNIIREKHLGIETARIELANQVSFLNRASIQSVLDSTPSGTHLLLDGSNSDYIDPDVLSLLRDFRDTTSKAHKVKVSFRGFKPKYQLNDDVRYVEHATKELQQLLTPLDVLEILKEGNQRFTAGQRLNRNLREQVALTSRGQFPLAAVLSCIDSRAPVETILDLGLGDIFSIRLAGNVTSGGVIGSLEYACSVAGAKLVLVLGHTRCGAVTSTVQAQREGIDVSQATGCSHLFNIVDEIRHSIRDTDTSASGPASEEYIDQIASQNVFHSLEQILSRSHTIRSLVESNKIAMVGAMYDVATGKVEFYEQAAHGLSPSIAAHT